MTLPSLHAPCVLLAALASSPALAQTSGAGSLVSTPADGGQYHNIITLTNTGSTPIGSFWFAWTPGQDYLPTRPIFVIGPVGWFGFINNGPAPAGGYSVQWYAWDPDADIQPGQTLTGFEFVSPDGPGVLAGAAPNFPSHSCTDSYLYAGPPQGDPGHFLRVTVDAGPSCGSQDYNGDGDFGTDQDIEAFFACIAGDCCPTCCPCGQDFNGDGDFGTDQDIEAFFRILAGGTC